jgi:hypothetical protein
VLVVSWSPIGIFKYLCQANAHMMAPAFLHISRKLLSALLADQHGFYCHGQKVWEQRLLWWFKLLSDMRIWTLQSIDEGLCLPVNPSWVKKGNANRLD